MFSSVGHFTPNAARRTQSLPALCAPKSVSQPPLTFGQLREESYDFSAAHV